MIYFDSDMSKSTNTVVYFDWKTVIYSYVCGKCRTQFMLPMKKAVTFTDACVTRIIQRSLSAVATRVNVAKRNITTGLFGLAHVLMRLYRMDNSLVC
jgi:DNA-directed RNA polymerase subunit RPC12/RpoP